jgi:hypothetical protein
MMRKSKVEYEGTYRIKRKPVRMEPHNRESWEIIEGVMRANGHQAEFASLEAAVVDHKSGTRTAPHPYQFVTYCIRSGWLARVEVK